MLKLMQFIKRVERTKIEGYTINTTKVGKQYETAIRFEHYNWIVVERYDDINYAKRRHKYWCTFCENKPLYATDIYTNKQELF